MFARLGQIEPAGGGPYAYARMGFGKLAGFIVAWCYWIAIWAALPAVAIAFADYLHVFIPAFADIPIADPIVSVAVIVGVALLNMLGVEKVGRFQLVVVGIKLVPFVAVAFLGLFWVEWDHFVPFNPSNLPFMAALAATAPFMMFAFVGMETATVPAEHLKNPKRTIAIATLGGTLIAASIYTLGTLSVMGVMDRNSLAASSSPFADAAAIMWGAWASYAVAVAALLSSLAGLNGWTLIASQVPLAAARHGLLPKFFCELNRHGVPAKGIAISATLSCAVLITQSIGSKAMLAIYDFVVELSTVSYMVPYVFCSLVEGAIMLSLGQRFGFLNPATYFPAAAVAFAFSLWTIYGAGAEAAMLGFLLLLCGLPVYVAFGNTRESAAGTDITARRIASDD